MNIIDNIHLKNFKSLKDVYINGLKTYNLFVGRPNVGKSNILKGIGTFAIPFIANKGVTLYPLTQAINAPQIFHNGNISEEASIVAGDFSIKMKYVSQKGLKIEYGDGSSISRLTVIDMYVKKLLEGDPIVKPYQYGTLVSASKRDTIYLTPLSGYNLMHVVQSSEELKKEFSDLLKDYELNLVFDTSSQSIQVMKMLDESSSFLIPYDAIADTLKRLLYYEAATMSNVGSILTFEEIEAHAYPPYIVKIVQCILKNTDNQYFITTHSPYVINEFLQERKADVAVHIVDYKNGETIVKTLSESEIEDVYNYGIDLFFNTESLLD